MGEGVCLIGDGIAKVGGQRPSPTLFWGGGGCGWVGEGVGQRWFEVAGVIIERSVMVIICKKGRGGLMFESFRV